jgi:hypothetical protein
LWSSRRPKIEFFDFFAQVERLDLDGFDDSSQNAAALWEETSFIKLKFFECPAPPMSLTLRNLL